MLFNIFHVLGHIVRRMSRITELKPYQFGPLQLKVKVFLLSLGFALLSCECAQPGAFSLELLLKFGNLCHFKDRWQREKSNSDVRTMT